MEIAKPASREELIAYIQKQRTGTLYHIAPRKALERGLVLFSNSQSEAFSWDAKGVLVCKSKTLGVTSRFWLGDQELKSSCTCEGSKNAPGMCAHAVCGWFSAVYALSKLSLAGRKPEGPSRNWAEQILHGELEPSTEEESVPAVEPPTLSAAMRLNAALVILRPRAFGSLHLEAVVAESGKPFPKWKLKEDLAKAASNGRLASPSLQELSIMMGSAHQLAVQLQSGRPVTLIERTKEFQTELILHHTRDGVVAVSFRPPELPKDAQALDVWLWSSAETKTLYQAGPQSGVSYLRRLQKAVVGYTQTNRIQIIDRDHIHIPEELWNELGPIFTEATMPPWSTRKSSQPAVPRVIQGRPAIYLNQQDHFTKIESGFQLPKDQSLSMSRLQGLDRLHYLFPPYLRNPKGKSYSVVIDLLLQYLLSDETRWLEEAGVTLAEKGLLEGRWQKDEWQSFINLLNEWRKEQTTQQLLIIDENQWCAYHIDIFRALKNALVLGRQFPRSDLAFRLGFDTLFMDQQEGILLIRELEGACAEHDIDLLVEGKPVTRVDLDISLSATKVEDEDTRLDWFELHPSVAYQGQLIPEEQWEALLNSRTVQGPNGAMSILNDRSVRKLEKLQEMRPTVQALRNSPDQSWRMHRLHMIDALLLQEEGVACDLPEPDATILRRLISFTEINPTPLPDQLQATLRAYQKAGYDWLCFLYEHKLGGVLADDMGLGKTLQSLALLAAIHEKKTLQAGAVGEATASLVVAPPTLLFNWQRELETFCPRMRAHVYRPDFEMMGMSSGDLVLCSYEMARRNIEQLSQHAFECILFDEAQAVKNIKGQRAQAMRELRARFKLAITGTPVENHAREYFSIVDLALPGLLGRLQDFSKDLRAGALAFRLRRAKPFVLRREKRTILTELPPKSESEVYLDLSEEQSRFYTRAVADVKEEVAQAYATRPSEQAGIVALSAIMRLRQICISPQLIDQNFQDAAPKFDYLTLKLGSLQEEGQAALVFSHFVKGLLALQSALEQEGIRCSRMDGKTPTDDRRAMVDAFQAGELPVFLISTKTGGAGLNLTKAGWVFHLDPWWNPAVEDQATDRAHRLGRLEPVFVERLIMKHTIEEKMMALKDRKRELFRKILGSTDSLAEGATTRAGLTRDDFSYLLSDTRQEGPEE